jgi:hypothetical protein
LPDGTIFWKSTIGIPAFIYSKLKNKTVSPNKNEIKVIAASENTSPL